MIDFAREVFVWVDGQLPSTKLGWGIAVAVLVERYWYDWRMRKTLEAMGNGMAVLLDRKGREK